MPKSPYSSGFDESKFTPRKKAGVTTSSSFVTFINYTGKGKLKKALITNNAANTTNPTIKITIDGTVVVNLSSSTTGQIVGIINTNLINTIGSVTSATAPMVGSGNNTTYIGIAPYVEFPDSTNYTNKCMLIPYDIIFNQSLKIEYCSDSASDNCWIDVEGEW